MYVLVCLAHHTSKASDDFTDSLPARIVKENVIPYCCMTSEVLRRIQCSRADPVEALKYILRPKLHLLTLQ